MSLTQARQSLTSLPGIQTVLHVPKSKHSALPLLCSVLPLRILLVSKVFSKATLGTKGSVLAGDLALPLLSAVSWFFELPCLLCLSLCRIVPVSSDSSIPTPPHAQGKFPTPWGCWYPDSAIVSWPSRTLEPGADPDHLVEDACYLLEFRASKFICTPSEALSFWMGRGLRRPKA